MPLKSEPGEQKKEKKHPNNVSAAVLGISGSLVFRTKKRRVSNGAPTRVVRFLNSASVTRGKEKKRTPARCLFQLYGTVRAFLTCLQQQQRASRNANQHTHTHKKTERTADTTTLLRISIRAESASKVCPALGQRALKSPTFEKSRVEHVQRENSRERTAACDRHVGHLLPNGSARRLHLKLRRDSANEMRAPGREGAVYRLPAINSRMDGVRQKGVLYSNICFKFNQKWRTNKKKR